MDLEVDLLLMVCALLCCAVSVDRINIDVHHVFP